MAKWHLVTPSGAIVRTCEAEALPQARFRLAPIPKDHAVVSAASYGTGALRRDLSVPVRVRIGTRGKRTRDKTKAQRQARWRAKRLAEDAAFDHKRRYAHRVRTTALLREVAGQMVGLMVEQVDERTIAQRFGVAQQSVNHIRQAYQVPTARTIRRRQLEVLAWYYRRQGWSEHEIAARTGASRLTLRTIPREA